MSPDRKRARLLAQALAPLRERGAQVAVDDAGAGAGAGYATSCSCSRTSSSST
ncbi:glutamate synthase domain-containing protein 1 [Xanthomonas arboricola]|nr:glutamate synthase domain-containing protein 1 [Xanthomonas sp. 3307]